jgi:hypothetical protein
LLKGTTNFQEVEQIHEELKAVNKEEVIKRFKVSIPDYYGLTPAYFDKITINHANKQLLRLIKSWLKLRLNTPCEDELEDKNITILAKFKPKKAFKEVVNLILSSSKEEGPTLTCNLQLVVTDGPADSSIRLEINAIKAIAFELNHLHTQATVSAKMLRGNYCQAETTDHSVRLLFKPTHLLFTKSSVYTDNLLVENGEEQWNF